MIFLSFEIKHNILTFLDHEDIKEFGKIDKSGVCEYIFNDIFIPIKDIDDYNFPVNIEIDYDTYIILKKKNYENNKVKNVCLYDCQDIKNLSDNVTHIIFDNEFNQEIKENVLPKSLTYLEFGLDFNQEIKENVLPKSLTHLYFAFHSDFNQEIKENVLPESLTHLEFGWDFNQEIKENVLPTNLTYLTFGHDFNQEIKENVLPNSLTHLTFYCDSDFKQELKENVLPKNLKNLMINENIKIPNNLKCVIKYL